MKITAAQMEALACWSDRFGSVTLERAGKHDLILDGELYVQADGSIEVAVGIDWQPARWTKLGIVPMPESKVLAQEQAEELAKSVLGRARV